MSCSLKGKETTKNGTRMAEALSERISIGHEDMLQHPIFAQTYLVGKMWNCLKPSLLISIAQVPSIAASTYMARWRSTNTQSHCFSTSSFAFLVRPKILEAGAG
jgi:hypothetical protein